MREGLLVRVCMLAEDGCLSRYIELVLHCDSSSELGCLSKTGELVRELVALPLSLAESEVEVELGG